MRWLPRLSQERNLAGGSTTREQARKCVQKCTTCARANIRSKTASKPSRLAFPRHVRKGRRFHLRRVAAPRKKQRMLRTARYFLAGFFSAFLESGLSDFSEALAVELAPSAEEPDSEAPLLLRA